MFSAQIMDSSGKLLALISRCHCAASDWKPLNPIGLVVTRVSVANDIFLRDIAKT